MKEQIWERKTELNNRVISFFITILILLLLLLAYKRVEMNFSNKNSSPEIIKIVDKVKDCPYQIIGTISKKEIQSEVLKDNRKKEKIISKDSSYLCLYNKDDYLSNKRVSIVFTKDIDTKKDTIKVVSFPEDLFKNYSDYQKIISKEYIKNNTSKQISKDLLKIYQKENTTINILEFLSKTFIIIIFLFIFLFLLLFFLI